jgi:hypothetical protein
MRMYNCGVLSRLVPKAEKGKQWAEHLNHDLHAQLMFDSVHNISVLYLGSSRGLLLFHKIVYLFAAFYAVSRTFVAATVCLYLGYVHRCDAESPSTAVSTIGSVAPSCRSDQQASMLHQVSTPN